MESSSSSSSVRLCSKLSAAVDGGGSCSYRCDGDVSAQLEDVLRDKFTYFDRQALSDTQLPSLKRVLCFMFDRLPSLLSLRIGHRIAGGCVEVDVDRFMGYVESQLSSNGPPTDASSILSLVHNNTLEHLILPLLTRFYPSYEPVPMIREKCKVGYHKIILHDDKGTTHHLLS
jgi:hypothetical protein